MSPDNSGYLVMVLGAMGIFAVVLAWTDWYSNRR